MRLTLRTLLAYLDDRLAPQQAKEIGQKLTTSPFATELADRIRSVVRRRRLAKESAGQKNIDANLIAEYLDDQLTPELVALIEKEILTSDHSLAEVAATHQIIGSLNDPVDIAEPLKERLLRLGPQAEGDEDTDQSPRAKTDWTPLEAQNVRQKRSPMLLLGAMVLGWLILVATDSNLFRGTVTPATGDGEKQLLAGGPADPIDLVDGAGAQDAARADGAAGNPEPDPQTPQEPDTAMSPEPDIGPADPGERIATEDNVPERNGQPEQPGTTTEPPAVVETNTDPQMPITEPGPDMVAADPPIVDPGTAEDAPPVVYNVDDPYRMFMKYNAEPAVWSWVAPEVKTSGWNGQVRGNLLGLPHPFHASVAVLDAGWMATVRGQSLVRFADNGSGVELLDGGLVLQSAQAEASRPFVVQTGGLTFELDLPEDGRRVAVQVAAAPLPVGAEGVAEEQTTFLPGGRVTFITVFAADTQATMRVNGQQVTLPTGTMVTWRSDAQAPAPVAAATPDWIFSVSEPDTDSTRELLMDVATTFQKSPSITDSYDELLDSRNPMMAEYAVSIPALIRELDSLCEILLNSDQSGVRLAAIDGLQYAMTTSPGAMDEVSKVLRTRLTADETSEAVRLLMGISPVEAEDRFVSEWLVSMLENSRASMRELAIVNLERLTGTREGFQTDDEATRRGSSVRRWRRRLSRNDGRLLTPPG
ncbi:MAG: hypothetical protein NXI04_24930 [Planctomycetaceae bacterium]|nr:hypothetical protein [Planctomycetaceae bacterium]